MLKQIPEKPSPTSLKNSILVLILASLGLLMTAGAILSCAETGTSTPTDAARTCRLHSDCEHYETCVEGVCQVECREDRDCGERQECRRGQCEPMDQVPCNRDSDCYGDETCIGGYCQPETECTRSSDCGGGLVCLDGRCVDLSDDDTDVAEPPPEQDVVETVETPDTQPDAVDTNPPDTSETTDLIETDSDDPCPRRSGQYGEQCNCAEQCVSRLCLHNKLLGAAECTKPCSTRADCTDNTEPIFEYFCAEVPDPNGGTIHVCAVDDTGITCASPQDCTMGICTSSGSPNYDSICTISCASASDCMGDHSCSPVDTGGQTIKVCYPFSRGTPSCTDWRQCFSGMCLTPNNICTYYCESAGDCPTGYTCQEAQAGQEIFHVCTQ